MRKINLTLAALAVSTLLTGCSVKDVTLYEVGDMFDTGITTATTENNTADAQSNQETFLLSDMNVKESSLDEADSIPPYDFSGPSNLGMDSSNQEASAVTSVASAGVNDGPVIYLATYNDEKAVKTYECISESAKENVAKAIANEFREQGYTQSKVTAKMDVWCQRIYKALEDPGYNTEFSDGLRKVFKEGSSHRKEIAPVSIAGTSITVSDTLYWDYQIEFAVIKRVQDLLTKKGYRVILNKTAIEGIDNKSDTHKKKADRAKEEDAVLTIEVNVSGDSGDTGVQVVLPYEVRPTVYNGAATRVLNALEKAGWEKRANPIVKDNPDSNREHNPMLGFATCETFVLNLGSINNTTEFNSLTTETGLTKIAKAIADAIEEAVAIE